MAAEQSSGWRATAALAARGEDLNLKGGAEKQSPEHKRSKYKEGGEHGQEDEQMEELADRSAGTQGSGAGKRPLPTDSASGGPSVGSLHPSKDTPKDRGGAKGGKSKGKGKGSQADSVQLLAKAILSTHDAVRELQSNLDYVFIYADEKNKVMAAHIAEGKAFYALKQRTIQDNKDLPPAQLSEKLRTLGPASASQFIAVLEAITEDEPPEGDSVKPFWCLVRSLENELKGASNWERAAHCAGTWQTKKAHGSNRKIIAKPRLEEGVWNAVICLLKRAGCVVHRGQKPPRDGLHRAVQSIIQQ